MKKIDIIKKEVEELKTKLLEQEPEHFSRKDLIDSFFGALTLAFTFALKGLVLEVAKMLTATHIFFIILSTFIILTAEIYFIGYSRVKYKTARKFGQFWAKRIMAFYAVAIIVSVFFVFVFGLDRVMKPTSPWDIQKLIILISMPSATGAAIGDLLRKY